MTEILGLAGGGLGLPLDDLTAGAGRLVVPAVAMIVAFVGLALIRDLADPGTRKRGEAGWCYRDRTRRERIAATLASSEVPDYGQTRGWWITRIEFGIATTAVLVGLLWVLMPWPEPFMGEPGPILVPWRLVAPAALAGMLFGLGWMVRIYRAGLRNDSEPTWRYRDRQS